MKTDRLNKFMILNLGLILAALPAVVFFSRINLPPGGMYSVALIIYSSYGDFLNHLGSSANSVVSIISFLLNIPLLVMSYLVFGLEYLLKVLYASVAFPVYIYILGIVLNPILGNYSPNMVIAVLMGGVIMGAGIAIAIFGGANTGGVDIVAQVVNRYLPFVSLGTAIAILNGIIMLLALLILGASNAILGLFTIFIISYTVDLTLKFLENM